MQRFFLLNQPLAIDQTVDLTPLLHQLRVVLRLRVGDQIILLDNSGNEFLTEIHQLEARHTRGLILRQQPVSSEPPFALTLYQCSLKAEKFEWVLQKGTELGVTHFAPVISERSVVRPAAALLKKYERWQTILREAAEQSGGGRIPALLPPLTFQEAVHQPGDLRLLPWEESREDTTVPHLRRAFAEHSQPIHALSLLIGPEGGLTANEVAQAQVAGWQIVSLGPRILRAETAALASVAILLAATV